LLDAVILLENEGKVGDAKTASYSSKNEPPREEAPPPHGGSFGEMVSRFFRWVGKILGIANTNFFAVEKKGEEMFSVPVTVFVVLTIFCFWAVIPLLIVGLFFGLRYSFRGPNLGNDTINKAMRKATDVATDIKEEIRGKSQE